MKIVGLTGGIGSGKTTVAKMFEELGVPVYNSDIEAKRLMHDSKKIRTKLIDLFGEEAYVNDELNRPYIANEVFRDKVLLEKLEKIVHPEVRKDFLNWCDEQEKAYVVQETALLFENQVQGVYDKVVLVTAPLNIRINRILSRDNTTEEAILSRMQNQLGDEEKIPFSDYVIENIDLEKTRKKVSETHQSIMEFCQEP